MKQKKTVNPSFLFFQKKGIEIMSEILKRLDGETENQTLWRLGNAKAAGVLGDITWPEVAEFMNKTYREDETQYYDSSAYRKRYKNYRTSCRGHKKWWNSSFSNRDSLWSWSQCFRRKFCR